MANLDTENNDISQSSGMTDSFNLSRFLEAQEGVYPSVVEELRGGQKSGHWIWFIFPQIAGLGRSHMSERYAIDSIEEAKAYADHPVLGRRLIECIELVAAVDGSTAQEIFGQLDAMKFRSCLTLFANAVPEHDVYQDALRKYFGGVTDPQTTAALRSA